MGLSKIIAGGQTGVDRGALSAALAYNFPCGGWCPQGRLAEDGQIPEKYRLVELASTDYLSRTIKNIEASDGTVILYFNYLEGGTEETLWHCLQKKKPYKLIDGSQITIQQSTQVIIQFIHDYELQILNVAGPRLSKVPHCYEYSYQTISQVIKLLINSESS